MARNQPLQGHADINMSGGEIQGLHDWAKGNTDQRLPPIAWYWERWGQIATNTALSDMQPQIKTPFSQHFIVNNKQTIDSKEPIYQPAAGKCQTKSFTNPGAYLNALRKNNDSRNVTKFTQPIDLDPFTEVMKQKTSTATGIRHKQVNMNVNTRVGTS